MAFPHAHQHVARRVGAGSRPGRRPDFWSVPSSRRHFARDSSGRGTGGRLASCPGGTAVPHSSSVPPPQPSPHGRGSLPRLWRLFGISREGRGSIFAEAFNWREQLSLDGCALIPAPSHRRGSLPRLWQLFGISCEGRGDIFRRRLPLERKPLSPLAAFPLRSQHIRSLQHEGQRLRSPCEQSTDIRTRHLTQIGMRAELGESLR